MHHRAVRLGQVDAAALHQPPGEDQRWAAVGRRRAGRLPGAAAASCYELREREICAKRAEIGMVFQQFNLFPHMTALENVIEAPIRVKSMPKARGGRARRAATRPGGPEGQGGRLPQAAVRRPAAAGRDRPGARHGAQAHALRRADQRARPRAGRRGAATSCATWPPAA